MLALLIAVLSTQAPPPPDGTSLYAPTREGLAPLDAAREEKVRRIGKKLRCAVCQGESIVDSPASMAVAQLDKVRELVAEGKTDEEVFAFFASRYGEWVLLEPSAEGLNLVLWVGPGSIVLVGLVLVYLQTRKRPMIEVTRVPDSADAQTPAVSSSNEAAAALDTATLLAQVRADVDK
jgi:cytochrome c-type biogenesis protein CcmH